MTMESLVEHTVAFLVEHNGNKYYCLPTICNSRVEVYNEGKLFVLTVNAGDIYCYIYSLIFATPAEDISLTMAVCKRLIEIYSKGSK